MSLFGIVKEAIEKIFKTRDAAVKHVCIFALTGIISTGTQYFETMSKSMKDSNTTPDLSNILLTLLIWTVVYIVIAIYMTGYNLKFIHNAFDNTSDNVLPYFDSEPFSVFAKAFPLIFVWGLYILLFAIISGILTAVFLPLGLILGVAFVIFILFMGFVNIAFAKYYDRTGLFNISLPFSYMPKTGLQVIGIIFITLLLGILAVIPCAILGGIIGLTGGGVQLAGYAGAIFGGYLGTIIQLIWLYSLVQIYKEKIEN